MDLAGRRLRTTLIPICAAVVAACTSGSEAVPVPGADAVVTAPVATIELPPVSDLAITEPSTVDEVDAPVPTPDERPATTTSAPTTTPSPVTTQAPPPSTTAPAPPETTAAVPVTDAPSDDVFLRIGDEGPEVGVMQLKLSVIDYLPAGSDTGVFDEATQRGLRRFQADYGLGVDGIFGPLTGRALNAAVQSINVEG